MHGEQCTVCDSPLPQGRPRGPGAGRCCSMDCVQQQSQELHRLRAREAAGQKGLEVFA